MPEYPRKFIYKGEEYMSFKGSMVVAKTYWYYNQKEEPDAGIFLKHGTSYKDLMKAQDRLIQRYHESFPRIRNMQEHFEYILKHHMEFEDAVKLREKMRGKTDEEKIRMLPPAFAWVLSIHLLQQKRVDRSMVQPVLAEPAPESNLMGFEDESDPLEIL